MNIVAIIQARMSSTRLPGKVLMDLAEKPVLHHVVERLRYCRLVSKIVVATTVDSSDDPIEDYCKLNRFSCFRGSMDDVLDRYYQAVTLHSADVIVRITADCPVIDPVIVDAVIMGYIAGSFDYYGLGGEFPDGLDCTVISFNALKTAWEEARLKSEREHVGPYIEKHPERFRNGALKIFEGLSQYRWTLDESRDYELLKTIFKELYQADKPFLTSDILFLLSKYPDLKLLNQGIVRNEGYQISLKNDGVIE